MSNRDMIRVELNRIDEAKIKKYKEEIARLQEFIDELEDDIARRNYRMGTN